MAREKPALQASYTIGWGKQPQVEKTTTNKRTTVTLFAQHPQDDEKEVEVEHSNTIAELLDDLGISYRIVTEERETVDTDKETDPGFTAAVRRLAESLNGEFGSCSTTWNGGIVLETHAEFGPSKHIERRAQVESFYAMRGLQPGDWSLDCKHVFSSATCKPLALKVETIIDEGDRDEAEVIEEQALDAAASQE